MKLRTLLLTSLLALNLSTFAAKPLDRASSKITTQAAEIELEKEFSNDSANKESWKQWLSRNLSGERGARIGNVVLAATAIGIFCYFYFAPKSALIPESLCQKCGGPRPTTIVEKVYEAAPKPKRPFENLTIFGRRLSK